MRLTACAWKAGAARSCAARCGATAVNVSRVASVAAPSSMRPYRICDTSCMPSHRRCFAQTPEHCFEGCPCCWASGAICQCSSVARLYWFCLAATVKALDAERGEQVEVRQAEHTWPLQEARSRSSSVRAAAATSAERWPCLASATTTFAICLAGSLPVASSGPARPRSCVLKHIPVGSKTSTRTQHCRPAKGASRTRNQGGRGAHQQRR